KYDQDKNSDRYHRQIRQFLQEHRKRQRANFAQQQQPQQQLAAGNNDGMESGGALGQPGGGLFMPSGSDVLNGEGPTMAPWAGGGARDDIRDSVVGAGGLAGGAGDIEPPLDQAGRWCDVDGIVNSPVPTVAGALGVPPPGVDMGGTSSSLQSGLGGLTLDGGGVGQPSLSTYQQQHLDSQQFHMAQQQQQRFNPQPGGFMFQQPQQHPFGGLGSPDGGGPLSEVGLIGMNNNSSSGNNSNSIPLRPDAQQPSMVIPAGGVTVGDQVPPGDGGGGSGRLGGVYGSDGGSMPFSPSSTSNPPGSANVGPLSGMPGGGGRAQPEPEFSLGGGGGGGGGGSGYPVGPGPDSGRLFGEGDAAADGRGVQDMNAAAAAASTMKAVSGEGGVVGGGVSRSLVQTVVAPSEQGEWVMYTSKENGNRAYWHNAKLNKTTWDDPHQQQQQQQHSCSSNSLRGHG
ncbi:unnamed protein product, partial [Ectocarpus sp. 12 AP-2014]